MNSRSTAGRVVDRCYPPLLDALALTVLGPVMRAPYLQAARFTQRFEAWPRAEREQWRAEALTAIVDYVADHVPAYRSVPKPNGGPFDLAELDIVSKQSYMDRPHDFLSDEAERLPVIMKHTGGSTGDPWNYPLDRVAWAHSYGIQLRRLRELGIRYGHRRITLGMPTSHGLDRESSIRAIRFALERTNTELCSFDIGPAASLDRARRAVAMNAPLWYGYAGTVAAMAEAVLNRGETLRGPKVIVTMAEPLWPGWKAAIETAFGSNVVEEYGCNDGGILAHRCPEGNLHLADHQSIVEVIDDRGRPCDEGVDGDLIITNLHARHMPFLRYKVGDVAAFGPWPCPCGRPGRTLARVSGRSGDSVMLPDGRALTPVTFFPVFNDVADHIRQWQMVQPGVEKLIIRIEARPSYGPAVQQEIQRYVRSHVGDEIDLRITTDEPIELTPGGKHKVLIRQFEAGEAG